MSDVENWRAEFEAWAKTRNMTLCRKSTGEYFVDSTEDRWIGWQAAKVGQAPHCELGDMCNCGGDVKAIRESCSRWIR